MSSMPDSIPASQVTHEPYAIESETANLIDRLASSPDVESFFGLFVFKETVSQTDTNPDGTPAKITPTLIGVKHKTGGCSMEAMSSFMNAIISNMLNHDPMMAIQMIADMYSSVVTNLSSHVINAGEEDKASFDEGIHQLKDTLMDVIFSKLDFASFLIQFNQHTRIIREKNPELPMSYSEQFTKLSGLDDHMNSSENSNALSVQTFLTNTLADCRPEHRVPLLEHIAKFRDVDFNKMDFEKFKADLLEFIAGLPIDTDATEPGDK